MSGAIAAAVLTPLLAASLDGSVAGSPISLGDFVFQGFEIPESVSWGGKQRLNVHQFPGGGRVIDVMGPDDAEVAWSGIFLGPDASARADQLNLMRQAGELIELLFLDRFYVVVISDFQADMRKLAHVPYRISCTVLTLPWSAPDQIQEDTTPAQQASDDLSTAKEYTDSTPKLAAASKKIEDLPTPPTYQPPPAASVAEVHNKIAETDAPVEVTLADFNTKSATTSGVLGESNPIAATNAMSSAADASETAAKATAADAFTMRAWNASLQAVP